MVSNSLVWMRATNFGGGGGGGHKGKECSTKAKPHPWASNGTLVRGSRSWDAQSQRYFVKGGGISKKPHKRPTSRWTGAGSGGFGSRGGLQFGKVSKKKLPANSTKFSFPVPEKTGESPFMLGGLQKRGLTGDRGGTGMKGGGESFGNWGNTIRPKKKKNPTQERRGSKSKSL